MRRYFVWITVAALLMAVSCEQPIMQYPEEASRVVSFRAILEGGSPETKTVLGEKNSDGYYPVYWSEQDSIKIVTNLYECSDGQGSVMELSSGAGTNEAVFTGEIPVLTEGARYYYAIYPYHISASIGEKQDEAYSFDFVEIPLPSTQQFAPHSFGKNNNPAVAITDNDVLRFKNACGLLQINLTGDVKVGKITIEDGDGASLWGVIQFRYDGNEYSVRMQDCDLQWGNSTGMKQSVLTLDCGAGVQLSDVPTDFYFAIPGYDNVFWYGQGTYDWKEAPLSKGFTLRIFDDTGREVYTKVTEQDNSVARSMITEMPVIDVRTYALEDLSPEGSANCYIVKPNTTCRFFAGYRGNSTYPVPSGAVVDVLWETINDNETAPGIRGIIEEGVYNPTTGYITLKTTSATGNALIALKDPADKVIWSWHIWVTDYDPEEGSGQDHLGNIILMDRDLGSIGVGEEGLKYEWGRKDPFFEFASSPAEPFNSEYDLTGDDFVIVDYGVAHPTTYITSVHSGWAGAIWDEYRLWGKEKTMYDPCPPGWQVCDHEVMYKTGWQDVFVNSFWTNWHASHNYGVAYLLTPYEDSVLEVGSSERSGVRCQKSTTIQILEEIDLSQNGTANCYIVEPGKNYKFKASVKGNSSESTGAIAEVARGYYTVNANWVNGETWIATDKELVSNLSLEGGYVHFQTFNSNYHGNETILVKDSHGNVLWSWHIWCPEVDPETNTYTFGGDEMMPLNLGALNNTPGTSESLGLMYQWGRKDPFLCARASGSSAQAEYVGDHGNVEASNETSNLTYAISHPLQFIGGSTNWLSEAINGLWGSTKTIYDPCPPGWKVPSRPASAPDVTATFDTENGGLTMGDVWYPASGYRHSSSFNLHNAGLDGHYWYATSFDDDTASAFYFNHESNSPSIVELNTHADNKAQANSVRCVRE